MKINRATLIELLLAIFAVSMNFSQEKVFGGWGIQTLLIILVLCCVFVAVQDKNKKGWLLNGLCGLFAFFTLIGQSYIQLGNFDVLFADMVCVAQTLIRGFGYTLIFRNSILFVRGLCERAPKKLWRREAGNKIEKWLFEDCSFWGALLLIWLFETPWLISFLPGTLEPDAKHQLLMALNYVEITGHHPVIVTKLMGKCMYIGRILFGNDTMGIFVYTFSQFITQSLVFAYTSYVLGKIKVPICLRWVTLAYYCIYPIFPMWGITMVKDTGYYILILLFVAALVHLLREQDTRFNWLPRVLLVLSIGGISCFRKDGCAVVIVVMLCAILVYRKYWKIFLLGIVTCFSCFLLVNKVYMTYENIPGGSVREMLSIPLQQTARYVKEHYDEIASDEVEVLQEIFAVELEQLAEIYHPELSDPVKQMFLLEPTDEQLKAYLDVWWQQFLKHPDTYIQAFFNHTYGYYYPGAKESWEGEDIGVFNISECTYFNINFIIEDFVGRELLEEYSRFVKRIPIIGMLYRVGLHTWILLGCICMLIAKKRGKELVVYLPGICIVAICIISPVNTCVRYMLPVMALLPIHLGCLTKKMDEVPA